MAHNQETRGWRQRWDETRPKKTLVFFTWLGVVVLTAIIGFSWGGWVTGGNAAKQGQAMAKDAVALRLEPICVAQFYQDAGRDQKLVELKDTSIWQRRDYVAKQGWATMPGEVKPYSVVADGCAKRLMVISEQTASLVNTESATALE